MARLPTSSETMRFLLRRNDISNVELKIEKVVSVAIGGASAYGTGSLSD